MIWYKEYWGFYWSWKFQVWCKVRLNLGSLFFSSFHLTPCSLSTEIETYKQLWHKTLQLYQGSKVSSHVNRLPVSAGAHKWIFFLFNVASKINWLRLGSHTSKVTSPPPHGHVIWPCGVCVFSRFLPQSKHMHTSV